MTTQYEKDMAAVQKNGWALEYVKEQTPEICLAAVQQDGWALEYVKEQTPEICLAAVQQDGWALRYVKKQTPEICLAAVRQDGRALRYVKEQTPEKPRRLTANNNNTTKRKHTMTTETHYQYLRTAILQEKGNPANQKTVILAYNGALAPVIKARACHAIKNANMGWDLDEAIQFVGRHFSFSPRNHPDKNATIINDGFFISYLTDSSSGGSKIDDTVLITYD